MLNFAYGIFVRCFSAMSFLALMFLGLTMLMISLLYVFCCFSLSRIFICIYYGQPNLPDSKGKISRTSECPK